MIPAPITTWHWLCCYGIFVQYYWQYHLYHLYYFIYDIFVYNIIGNKALRRFAVFSFRFSFVRFFYIVLPFTFSSVKVSNNGHFYFTPKYRWDYFNYDGFPVPDYPYQDDLPMIAPFYARVDINPRDDRQRVYYRTMKRVEGIWPEGGVCFVLLLKCVRLGFFFLRIHRESKWAASAMVTKD